ncbi:GDP-mannose 4,6-dehydratase [Solirubrobacter ginsenosidimutans]|uniref:GDP-mannose 4,6-dehydratase n=1 Tax=Solirubrobacter ginsenosidimutans TaxID=490573 RepID=A0A9X3MTE6_9ACTN|nr:NAD-dependent epimerase/dehydratase family protein [Solirubrobacter ginsenosidimutans]MDA0161516.1 GDP-mannose 4,6-dehydratase [Solirubrobacter ginsenosidimutans]
MIGERVLVTGGAGYIGSNLVDALLDRGDHVTVLDDRSTGRIENLAGAIGRGATVHTADVVNADAVARVFAAARPSVVYHLAAQIDVRRAIEDPARDARINVAGTATVLEQTRRSGVERFVLASTGGAIYGDAAIVPTPETEPARPLSPYALSKAAAEHYVEYYALRHGLSAFVLRLANVYGPRQDPRGEAGVIARFCGAAADGREVTVFGDGHQTRDFVYVDDAVEAFVAAGEHRVGGCCNVATGRETSVLDLVRALDLPARFVPERPGEVRRSCLEAARAAELLGWHARTALHDGLAATLTSTAAETAQARGA